jgi:hypothetical protein
MYHSAASLGLGHHQNIGDLDMVRTRRHKPDDFGHILGMQRL